MKGWPRSATPTSLVATLLLGGFGLRAFGLHEFTHLLDAPGIMCLSPGFISLSSLLHVRQKIFIAKLLSNSGTAFFNGITNLCYPEVTVAAGVSVKGNRSAPVVKITTTTSSNLHP